MYYVYVLANGRLGTLYVGFTNDLLRRVHQYKNGIVPGFTKRYHVSTLVYFEPFDDVREAILREKRIKAWKRDWKIALIERSNPEWYDLYERMPPF